MLSLPTRLWRVTLYSMAGFKAAFRYEWAFRLELAICVIAIPLGLYLGATLIQKILLVSSLLLILIVELINSAIETVIDRISLDHHELSGQAKDIGSAAVFMSVINALFIWITILVFK